MIKVINYKNNGNINGNILKVPLMIPFTYVVVATFNTFNMDPIFGSMKKDDMKENGLLILLLNYLPR